MQSLSLSTLLATRDACEGALRAQVVTAQKDTTKGGKPYMKLTLCDGSAQTLLRVWDNHGSYAFAGALAGGEVAEFTGTWVVGEFGLESGNWKGRLLEGDERTAVFAGPPELREKQERDWLALTGLVSALPDGSLKVLTTLLLGEHEESYRRAAAARGNHHARRGGLVEHVSLMAQAAMKIADVYPELRRDLLLAGVVFHDCGKMVENNYQAQGFEMPFTFTAECYGHIAIGVQVAHTLWKKLPEEAQKRDRLLLDALCHLILSHHGQLEWGSPVEPKLPEAFVLHQVDMIDAKLEMARGHRATAKLVAPGVYDRHRHLGNLLILPEPQSALS